MYELWWRRESYRCCFIFVSARTIYRTLFKKKVSKVNELFLPGRMAYQVELEDEYAESDIPTTIIRSKADCPTLEVSMNIHQPQSVYICKSSIILRTELHMKWYKGDACTPCSWYRVPMFDLAIDPLHLQLITTNKDILLEQVQMAVLGTWRSNGTDVKVHTLNLVAYLWREGDLTVLVWCYMQGVC